MSGGFTYAPLGATKGELPPGFHHLQVRLGPFRLDAPTRIVYVVDEADRRGFAYGTLQGHPESGEELFLVERTAGSTYAEARAFSRAGRWFTRIGGPVSRRIQRHYVARYLDAVASAVSS